jgi:hypothetical protein
MHVKHIFCILLGKRWYCMLLYKLLVYGLWKLNISFYINRIICVVRIYSYSNEEMIFVTLKQQNAQYCSLDIYITISHEYSYMFQSTRDHNLGTKPKQYHIKPNEPLLYTGDFFTPYELCIKVPSWFYVVLVCFGSQMMIPCVLKHVGIFNMIF